MKIITILILQAFAAILMSVTSVQARETYFSGADLSAPRDVSIEGSIASEPMSFTPSNGDLSGLSAEMPQAIGSIQAGISNPSLKWPRWEWNVPELQSAFQSVFRKYDGSLGLYADNGVSGDLKAGFAYNLSPIDGDDSTKSMTTYGGFLVNNSPSGFPVSAFSSNRYMESNASDVYGLAGFSYNFTPSFGLFSEYRFTPSRTLSVNGASLERTSDYQVETGIKFSF